MKDNCSPRLTGDNFVLDVALSSTIILSLQKTFREIPNDLFITAQHFVLILFILCNVNGRFPAKDPTLIQGTMLN